jgi:hypothetical protein
MDKMEEDGGRPVPLQFGQIKHIEEILATKDLNGQSVRVLGKCVRAQPPPRAKSQLRRFPLAKP